MADPVSWTIGGIALAMAVPSTIDSISKLFSSDSKSEAQDYGFPDGYFYMTDGEVVIGNDGRTDSSNDPLFNPTTDIHNQGVRFVWKNGNLFCMCSSFPNSQKTHIVGFSESKGDIFAAYDGQVRHKKYKWKIEKSGNPQKTKFRNTYANSSSWDFRPGYLACDKFNPEHGLFFGMSGMSVDNQSGKCTEDKAWWAVHKADLRI